MRPRWLAVIIGVTFALILFSSAPNQVLAAESPKERVQNVMTRILDVIKDESLSAGSKKTLMREITLTLLDVEETAKRALGRHWSALTMEQRREFTRLFTDVLERSYLNQVSELQSFNIGNARVEEGRVEVDVQVTAKKHELKTTLVLHEKAGEWKVYDVRVEGVGLVNNYRTQFNKILAADYSFAYLLQRIQENVDVAQGKEKK